MVCQVRLMVTWMVVPVLDPFEVAVVLVAAEVVVVP